MQPGWVVSREGLCVVRTLGGLTPGQTSPQGNSLQTNAILQPPSKGRPKEVISDSVNPYCVFYREGSLGRIRFHGLSQESNHFLI